MSELENIQQLAAFWIINITGVIILNKPPGHQYDNYSDSFSCVIVLKYKSDELNTFFIKTDEKIEWKLNCPNYRKTHKLTHVEPTTLIYNDDILGILI